MKYFSSLPDIFYNDTLSKNILTRATLQSSSIDRAVQYQPYVSEFGERLENLSYAYYGTCDQYWLIALANKIIDPYYDISLSVESFTNLITKKYGSLENALSKILFYRNNWYNTEEVITVGRYNSLPSNQKKYWNPITTNEVVISGYERKKEDTVLNTNMIITASGTFTELLDTNERVLRLQSGIEIGSGVVSFCNTSIIMIKHVTGTFEPVNNAEYNVVGETSNNSGTVSSIDLINYTIPQDELVYFSSVNAYEYETELNVQKTNLSLIGAQYVEQMESMLTTLYPESQ